MDKIKFMTCNSCKHLVQVNATGICLGCQMGFAGPQEDSWKHHPDAVESYAEEATPISPPSPKKRSSRKKHE